MSSASSFWERSFGLGLHRVLGGLLCFAICVDILCSMVNRIPHRSERAVSWRAAISHVTPKLSSEEPWAGPMPRPAAGCTLDWIFQPQISRLALPVHGWVQLEGVLDGAPQRLHHRCAESSCPGDEEEPRPRTRRLLLYFDPEQAHAQPQAHRPPAVGAVVLGQPRVPS